MKWIKFGGGAVVMIVVLLLVVVFAMTSLAHARLAHTWDVRGVDFRRAMREGKSRDGRDLSPVMPWPAMKNMTDTELDATFAYLPSLPAKPTGTH